MDRDANWGCVRGMINVTPRGAGSCAKKPFGGSPRKSQERPDKKETGEDLILGG